MDETGMMKRGARLAVSMIKMHPVPFAVSVVGATIFAGATVASTVVLKWVTDNVVLVAFESGEVSTGEIWWGVGAVMAVAVIRSAGVVMRRYFAGMTAERSQVTFRHRLVDRYLGLPLSWYTDTPAGRLLAHADSDTDTATNLLHPLPFSLGAGLMVLFSTILLLVTDPVLALVALVIFPLLSVMNRIYSSRVEGPAADVQAGIGQVSSVAHESFDGALVVKTLGRADGEVERFSATVDSLRAKRLQVGYIRAAFEAVLEGIPTLGIVAVVTIGAIRVGAGAITHGDVVQVVALFNLMIMPMRVFGFFLETIPPSVVSHRRLQTVFDRPVISAKASQAKLADRPVALDVADVVFGYEDDVVLNHVNLEIKPGEVVAIVGATGAGKSTLISVLAGLLSPQAGTIHMGHLPLEEIDQVERTNTVALAFQESFLFADTIRANLDMDGSATDLDIRAALVAAEADGFVDELPDGLETVVGERGVTLSGGQRQRLALARAIIRRPRLMLLDDATSAVDSVVEANILAGLRRSVEATIVIVAQRVSTIEMADRVLFLVAGRIEATGTHRQLLSHPGYEALVTAYETEAS